MKDHAGSWDYVGRPVYLHKISNILGPVSTNLVDEKIKADETNDYISMDHFNYMCTLVHYYLVFFCTLGIVLGIANAT